MMKVLVLSVDRDDDFGVKTGLSSPFIGRQENIDASLALGLKDPEDSDINTTLAAIGIYEEMLKKGIEAEIATICGDAKVGYESDLVLATQLENVLEVIKPDRVVLVSDGAEDEYIFPMVASRVKVDSVRRVFVKQAPTVEGTYYILMKMLQDDKVRKRILPPIGLVLLVLGIFAVVPKLIEYSTAPTPGLISEMGVGIISIVLGLYLIFYAYKVGEKVENSALGLARAVRSGSWMIPFAALTMIFLIAGVSYGFDAASRVVNNDLVLQAILFASGTIWLWTFAGLSWFTGKFFNLWLSTNKIHYSYLVVTLSVFAIAFILQGALDATMYFLGYRTFNDIFVFFEILTGFMLALFGGLLNTALRNQDQMRAGQAEAEKPVESSN